MEEELKKMILHKIAYTEEGLTDGEAKLAIYLLEQEKTMKKEPEEIKIGKKITITGTGGIGTKILLDDKYSIDGLYRIETEMHAENGIKVILEFSPNEIEIKTNKEEAVF